MRAGSSRIFPETVRPAFLRIPVRKSREADCRSGRRNSEGLNATIVVEGLNAARKGSMVAFTISIHSPKEISQIEKFVVAIGFEQW